MMKPIRQRRLLAAALCLLGAASLHAGETYYRWLDSQGNPVNSDRPPPAGTDYEVIAVSPNMMRQVTSDQPAEAPAAPAADGSGPADNTVTQQKIVMVKNPETCRLARENLHTLNTYARIREPDGQGSLRFINEDEKAVRRKEAETLIEQNCE
jgi:hypothetical protein